MKHTQPTGRAVAERSQVNRVGDFADGKIEQGLFESESNRACSRRSPQGADELRLNGHILVSDPVMINMQAFITGMASLINDQLRLAELAPGQPGGRETRSDLFTLNNPPQPTLFSFKYVQILSSI